MRKTPFPFALLLTLLPALLGGAAARAGQTPSKGVFTDKSGTRHPWAITATHTLVWDDRPFVPVGGRFQAKSWSPSPTEADFKADVDALATLKASGVTDVYLQPSRRGITSVPPAAIQRLMDHLDGEGFTYGLSLNDGPQEVLVGYDVRPGKYRAVVPEDGGAMRFPMDAVASALYFLVPENGTEIVRNGEADMVQEGARVSTPPIPGRYVVFLVPQKVYFTAETLGFPNLWEGFDAYRDALLALFRQVRPGKGFRFFVDPLPSTLHLSEASESFIPVSEAFATEWAEWLAKRYKNIDNLQTAWAMGDRELREFREAARLLPLWGGGKGVEFVYDRATGRTHRVTSTRSEFWRDMNAFKTESVREYMNDLATALKRAAADVPVVYRTRGYSPLFANLPANRGFDGIGVDAYGRGSDLVTRSAGYTYALAAEARKTMWLPVTGTGESEPQYKKSPGYPSRTVLHAALDWLREIGARGFYVDGVRVTDPARRLYDLSAIPEQLRWLSDYGRILEATGVSGTDKLPTAVFYPRGLYMASLKPLSTGGWWLPTDRPGVVYDYGAAGRAYALAESDGAVVYYLWNPAGKREIRLKMPKAIKAPDARPVRWSSAARGSVKKDVLTLTVGPEPVRLENYPVIPVPLDAFNEAMEEAKRLTKVMRDQNRLDAGRFEGQVTSIKSRFNPDNPMLSLVEALKMLDEVRAQLRAYLWIEAEQARGHNFDEVDDRLGASGGLVLAVDPRLPGASAATAAYGIEVRRAGTYHIWVAASPDAELTFRIGGKNLLDEATALKRVGTAYADGALMWIKAGVATLPPGVHAFEVRAANAALLDVILITQDEFTPDGPNPPPVQP